MEWDEPREVNSVEVDFPPGGRIPPPGSVRIEYWVSSWPPRRPGEAGRRLTLLGRATGEWLKQKRRQRATPSSTGSRC